MAETEALSRTIFVIDVGGYVGSAICDALSSVENVKIVGTVSDAKNGDYCVPENVAATADSADTKTVREMIISSDVVICDCSRVSVSMEALKILRKNPQERHQRFICVSSIMTWARTGQKVSGLKEKDFKNRKPSIKCQELKNFEMITLHSNSKNLSTVVIGAGVLYGRGESLFECFFRDSWLNCEDALGIPGLFRQGKNVIPTVHVSDVASIVRSFCVNNTEAVDKGQYFVAIDKSRSTLEDICVAISKEMGSGETRLLKDNEIQELLVESSDIGTTLQANIVFDTTDLKVHNLDFEWHSAGGIVENIAAISEEFKKYRGLRPVKIVCLGPPASGKTFYAERLAKFYQVPLLDQV